MNEQFSNFHELGLKLISKKNVTNFYNEKFWHQIPLDILNSQSVILGTTNLTSKDAEKLRIHDIKTK